MSKKLEKDFIYNEFLKCGFTILDINEYKGFNIGVLCKDSNGYFINKSYKSIKRNPNIESQPFHVSNRHSLENIKIFLKNNNIDSITLNDNQIYTKYNDEYSFKCDVHGNFNARLDYFLRYPKCQICNPPKSSISDNNRLSILRPDLIKYFKNKDDADNYAIQSNVKTTLKCPTCGNEREYHIYSLTSRGFYCDKCSDGVSIGEKLCRSLLNELNVNYDTEKSFKWSNKKRYDVYIPSIDTIIEIHGKQHYVSKSMEKFKKLEDEIKNDKFKMDIAKQNGIRQYVVIDARESNLDFIRRNLESSLCGIFDLSNIDWELVFKNSLKSAVITACNMYNKGVTMQDIAKSMKIHICTVRDYLGKGTDANLCKYVRSLDLKHQIHKYDKNMNYICSYKNQRAIGKHLGLCSSTINRYLGTGGLYRGFYWYRELK